MRQGLGSLGRRGAFTLVEVLLVVSIIILLLGTLFPAVNAVRRSQKVARTEAAIQAIASGVESYQCDYGIYPPAEFLEDPVLNWGARSLTVLLNLRGGRGWPYVPSGLLGPDGNIEDRTGSALEPVLRDEWDRPLIYFDTSVMRAGTSHDYDLLGDRSVQPARGATGDFYNFGRFQLWSCGPNEQNNQGRGQPQGGDDVANFVAK